VSLRQFNVYAGRGGESALQLVESGELSTSTLLSNVDRYSNLTIGVSLVNSAGLESAIERTVFVGSKHRTNIAVYSSCSPCNCPCFTAFRLLQVQSIVTTVDFVSSACC